MSIFPRGLFLQIITFSGLLLFIFSCQEKTEEFEYYNSFPEEIYLTSTVHPIDTVIFRYPYRIKQFNDGILIFDLHNPDYFFHSFRLPNYKYETSFGRKGEGDEEIVIADDLRIGENNDVWVLSNPLKQLWKYNGIDEGVIQREEVVRMEDGVVKSCNFVIYNDNSFILPDYSGESRFLMLNKQGEITKRLGNVPTKKHKALLKKKPLVLGNPWFSYLSYNPRNNILASVTQLGEVMEIYNLKNDKIIVKYGPGGEPIFKEVEDGFGYPTQDGIRGFWDVKVTDNLIYALFDGRTFREMFNDPTPIEGGNQIYVFDLEGRPIWKYILDRRISGFDINTNRGIIYGVDLNNDEPIVQFSLLEK